MSGVCCVILHKRFTLLSKHTGPFLFSKVNSISWISTQTVMALLRKRFDDRVLLFTFIFLSFSCLVGFQLEIVSIYLNVNDRISIARAESFFPRAARDQTHSPQRLLQFSWYTEHCKGHYRSRSICKSQGRTYTEPKDDQGTRIVFFICVCHFVLFTSTKG